MKPDKLNRLIRQRIGGDAVLDALANADALAYKLRKRGLPGAKEAAAALRSLRKVKRIMAEEIEAQTPVQETDK